MQQYVTALVPILVSCGLTQLVVYCSLLALGLFALHDQPWLHDSSFFWRGFPEQAVP